MTTPTPVRICKRCGTPLPKRTPRRQRVCTPCREGKGQMFEVFDNGRRSPEITSAVESDRRRH